jgi:competence protein ComEC
VTAILGDRESGGLVLALTTGFPDGLTRTTQEAFRALGLGHVLVISGYHLGVVFILVSSVVMRVLLGATGSGAVRLPLKPLSQFAALSAVLFLVLISNAGSSTLRAALALGLVFAGGLFGRKATLLQGVMFALLVLLLAFPLCFLQCGVQLSVAALFGIAVALAGSDEGITLSHQYCKVCLYAWLSTTVVGLMWFGQVSVIGAIANMIWAPILVAIGCKGGLIALVLLYTIDGRGVMLQIVSILLSGIKNVLRWCAEFESFVLEPKGAIRVGIALSLLLVLYLEFKRALYYYLQRRGVPIVVSDLDAPVVRLFPR